MIDRAMAQLVAQGCEKTDLEVIAELPEDERFLVDISSGSSRDGLIKSIIHGLECLLEDAPSPDIIAAIEAVRKIR